VTVRVMERAWQRGRALTADEREGQ
jgi:hypothetical protein